MSELKISNVIIHEIEKTPEDTKIQLSGSVISNNDEKINIIVNKLCDIFNTKSLERAIFSKDSKFVEETNKFANYDFKIVTQDLVKELKVQLTNATNAKGGFLVFFEHQSQKSNKFFSIFLVRNTNGFCFIRDQDTYHLNSIEHIDLNHIAMGARVNLTKYLNNSKERYVTLVRGNTDIAEYFKKWIGLDRQESEKKDCENLLKIADEIKLPERIESRDMLKKKIGDFIKIAPNKSISLRNLSEYLYQQSDYIQKYAEKMEIDIDTEFTVKATFLKHFFRVSAIADGIRIDAERGLFNNQVVQVEGERVIITSAKLVKAIESQI